LVIGIMEMQITALKAVKPVVHPLHPFREK
jgi:hypothetical protein